MFTLNPLGNPDALWQHSIMILVSAILGYIIGYIDVKQTVHELEKKLHQLDRDIRNWRSQNPVFDNTKASSHFVTARKQSVDNPLNQFQSDDLKIITGIDAKLEELLHSAKIHAFLELSEKTPAQLNEIVEHAGLAYQENDLNTWPQQARLASQQLWEELKKLQNEIEKSRS